MVLSLPFGCVEGIRSCENGAFPSGVPLNQGETGVQSKSGGGPRLKKIISIPGSLLGFEHVGLSLVRFGRLGGFGIAIGASPSWAWGADLY